MDEVHCHGCYSVSYIEVTATSIGSTLKKKEKIGRQLYVIYLLNIIYMYVFLLFPPPPPVHGAHSFSRCTRIKVIVGRK